MRQLIVKTATCATCGISIAIQSRGAPSDLKKWNRRRQQGVPAYCRACNPNLRHVKACTFCATPATTGIPCDLPDCRPDCLPVCDTHKR